MQPGDYTVGIDVARSDGTQYQADANFSVEPLDFSAGTKWTMHFTNAPASYVSGVEYSFQTPDTYSITYDSDNSAHPLWYKANTWAELNMPAGFELNTSNSPGWTQPGGVGTTIYFDPTVSGANPTFNGKFTAANGQTYTADQPSTISSYFGYDANKTSLTADPFTVKLVPPTSGLMLGNAVNTVTVATESNRLRPNIPLTYTQKLTFNNPLGNVAVTDVKQTVTPADGSVQLGATVIQNKPDEGKTITVVGTLKDGTTKTYAYTVTAADVTAGKATYAIPSTTESNPYTQIVVTYGQVSSGSSAELDVNDHSQATYADGTDIEDGDQRKGSETITGTTAQDSVGGSVQPKVNYVKNLVVADWDLGLYNNPWRSNYKSEQDFSYGDTTTYGTAGTPGGSLPASDSTRVIHEPIIYMMIPKGTTYAGYNISSQVTTQPAKVTVSTASNGQQVVKFDWTGTGYYMPTDISHPAEARWTIPKWGVPVTSPTAVWVSTVNDPQLTWKKYSVDGNATPVAIPDDVTSSATGGDTKAVLTGSMNIGLSGVETLMGTSTITNNKGVVGTDAVNGLADGESHSMNIVIVSNKPSEVGQKLASLTNLPQDCISLQVKGAGTITDMDGKAVSEDRAYLEYSNATQTPPAAGGTVSEVGYVKAADIASIGGWTAVKSFILVVPKLESAVEYSANVPLTDTRAPQDVNKQCTITSTAVSGTLQPFTSTVTDMYYQLSGKKIWDDADDQDGIQPDSVTVDLVDESGSGRHTNHRCRQRLEVHILSIGPRSR